MLSKFLCLTALVCALALSSFGGTINNAPWPPTASGGNFTWGFTLSTGANETIATNNYFVIYDFAGLVGGSLSAPADWTATTQLVTPPGQIILSYGDDATIENLVFTYIGTTPLTGAFTFTGFSAQSNTDAFVLKDGVSQSTNTAGIQYSTNAVGSPAVAPVPEPSSLMLLGSGLAGFAGMIRRKLNR